MDYSLLQDINVKASFLDEDVGQRSFDDEPEPDIPNPLKVPDRRTLEIALDAIDEIEGEYIQQVYDQLKAANKFDESDPKKWAKIANFVRRKYGTVQEVPIADLYAVEAKLYGDHLTRLAQGYIPTRGDKYPIVYILNNGMFLGDGNHRVVNELSKGKETVTSLVLDFRKQEKELM